MKLGVALLFFAALTQAKVTIEEKNIIDGLRREITKNADNLKELRAENAKLRQADPMRQDDIVEAVQEIVAAQLTGYQTKSEATSQLTAYKSEATSQLTAYQTKSEASSTYLKKTQAEAKIKSYLESHHICQAGRTWGYFSTGDSTITYSPAFPRKPTLSVSLGGFRSSGLQGYTGYIESYAPWNVKSETASSFEIDWSMADNMEKLWSHGITWIACM